MRKAKIGSIAFFLICAGVAFSIVSEPSTQPEQEDDWRTQIDSEEPVEATFAGGCFWCIEEIYDGREGVDRAVSGYVGGAAENATYDKVSTGETDHREAVKVYYYPSVVSYEELVDSYWRNIDPTDPGGQFSDRGYQYTTAIYYHSERQREIAESTKQNLSETKFNETIVTEIIEYPGFYRAEDYHQNYSQKNSFQYQAYKRASGREGFIESRWG